MKAKPKWLLGATIGLTLLGSPGPFDAYAQTATVPYADLDKASVWALDAIQLLNEQGIMQGYGDSTYQPRKPITREEVAALLARALNLQVTDSLPSGPPDLSPSSWSYPSVSRVVYLGIMGEPSEPFRPHDPVTREELVSIFAEATGAAGSGTTKLSDEEAGQVEPANREKVETSIELGLLQGDGNALNLDLPTERQEVAVVLFRLLRAMNAPAENEAVITIIGTDKIRLGAFEYPMAEELRSLLGPTNANLLDGATIKVKLSEDYRVREIVDLTIPAEKQDLVLDGGQLHITGNLTIFGDRLTVKNVNVDGSVIIGGDPKTSLTFENAGIAKLELGTPTRVVLGGNASVDSLVVSEEGVSGTEIVLRDEGAIEDIVIPDKRLVYALVKDYGINQGKVRLINGQPPETAPVGSVIVGQPTMLYALPIEKLHPAGDAYTLPGQVSVRMSDGSLVERNVVWQPPEGVEIANGQVLFTAPAVYTFAGTVDGLSAAATLNVDVRLPLKLSMDSAFGTIEADAGQSTSFEFKAEPVSEVVSSVPNVAYLLQWFDEEEVNRTSEVDLRDAGGLETSREDDAWVIRYPDGYVVAGQETISIEAIFNEAGTYTLRAAAFKTDLNAYN